MLSFFITQQIIQQPFAFFLHLKNIRLYFLKRAERLGLVKVPREADFIAYLGARLDYPCVRSVWQNFAFIKLLFRLFQAKAPVHYPGAHCLLHTPLLHPHHLLLLQTAHAAGWVLSCQVCVSFITGGADSSSSLPRLL